MSPVAIHPCGGAAHGSASVTDPHAQHRAALVTEVQEPAAADAAPASTDQERRACECVDCGPPTAAAAVPGFELDGTTTVRFVSPSRWPAASRRSISAVDHALPFANGPPQG